MGKISSRKLLKETLAYEFSLYFPKRKDYIRSFILRERDFYIWKYQKTLRHLEYAKEKMNSSNSLLFKILFAYYSRKTNVLGAKLGIDTWCNVFDRGLIIHHAAGGIIINSSARIGKNCHLHGDNCIGNNGTPKGKSPHIGDNCSFGVGAKVIGDIQLGNNIIVAAGSVVVKSCTVDGVTLAGIPATIIKK